MTRICNDQKVKRMNDPTRRSWLDGLRKPQVPTPTHAPVAPKPKEKVDMRGWLTGKLELSK